MHSCDDIVNRTNGTGQGWTESPGQAIGQRLDPRGCRHVLNVGWRTARASNGGLEAEPPPGSRGPGHRVRKLYGVCKSIGVDTLVCREKHSHFFGSASIRGAPSGKVGWACPCPPQSTPWRYPWE